MRSTALIKVVYYREINAYLLPMNTVFGSEDTNLMLKFDTGAAGTVIGIEDLFIEITDQQKEHFKEAFQNAGIEAAEFRSATKNSMKCYPMIMHDIIIDDTVKIREFPFYLSLERPISLLGADFISCCQLSLDIKGDIVISKYDSEMAISDFKKSNKRVFDADELQSIFVYS